MKVDRVELYYVKIPLSPSAPGLFGDRVTFHPNWIPGFRQTDVRFFLLRLLIDSGHEGVAAMPAMALERRGLGSLLGPYLLGLNPLDIRLVNQRIQEFNYIGMRNGWIDAAFWDLIGKIRGEPVWKLLGGAGGRARPYASLGDNHDHDPNVVADLVRRRRDQGFAGVKIRVKSMDLPRMVDVIAAARHAAGDSLDLMVDANLGWPVELLEPTPHWDEDFVARLAEAIAPYRITWLEEPYDRGAHEALARLRRRLPVPLAGAENISSWRELLSLLDHGSLDVYQPDAVLSGGTYAGGISVVYWLIREIQRRNAALPPGERPVRYTPHTWTNGLGFAVNLQLYALLPPGDRPLLEYPYDENWEPSQWARFIRGGFPRDPDGLIPIPDTPGLGVDIDWGVIGMFGKRLHVATPATVAASTLLDHGLSDSLHLRRKKQEIEAWSALADFRVPDPPF